MKMYFPRSVKTDHPVNQNSTAIPMPEETFIKLDEQADQLLLGVHVCRYIFWIWTDKLHDQASLPFSVDAKHVKICSSNSS